jgi:hypothetical protein
MISSCQLVNLTVTFRERLEKESCSHFIDEHWKHGLEKELCSHFIDEHWRHGLERESCSHFIDEHWKHGQIVASGSEVIDPRVLRMFGVFSFQKFRSLIYLLQFVNLTVYFSVTAVVLCTRDTEWCQCANQVDRMKTNEEMGEANDLWTPVFKP